MRLIGLLFLVFAALALAGWGVWTWGLHREGVQSAMYEKDAEARAAASAPHQAAPKAFRATICAHAPCVLIEAGGLAFLVDAGEGAADGLRSRGLMRPDLDAVMLTAVNVDSVEGLADVAAAEKAMGRTNQIPIYGPSGVERVVQGLNMMLSAPDPAPPSAIPAAGQVVARTGALVVGQSASTNPNGSELVFDSGVVSVMAFAAAADPTQRLYRFDFGASSIVVAPCATSAADLARSVVGAAQAVAILPASSPAMIEADRKASAAARTQPFRAPAACLSADDAVAAMKAAKLRGGLLAPLSPTAQNTPARRMWEESIHAPAGLIVAAGEPGTALDISSALTLSRNGKPVAAAKPAQALAPQKIQKTQPDTGAQKQAGP